MKYLNNNYVNISEYQKTKYNKILNIALELCSTFQIVEEYGDLEVDKLEIFYDLIQVKRSNEWPGTVSEGSNAYVYSFEITKNTEKFLSKYNSFFIVDELSISTKAFDDQSDYSFFEKGTGDCLLFTITHEGDVFLREDIYNMYFLEEKHQA